MKLWRHLTLMCLFLMKNLILIVNRILDKIGEGTAGIRISLKMIKNLKKILDKMREATAGIRISLKMIKNLKKRKKIICNMFKRGVENTQNLLSRKKKICWSLWL